jgi:hypothetical protein
MALKKLYNSQSILWGALYIIYGIAGIIISILAIKSGFGIVEVIGPVIAGAFIGIISVFLMIYGYRLIKFNW